MAEELEEAEFWLPSGFLADESLTDEGSFSADYGEGSDFGSSIGSFISDELIDEEESQTLASLSLNFSHNFLQDRELFPPLSSPGSKDSSTAGSPNSTLSGVWRRGNSSTLLSSLEKQSREKPGTLRSTNSCLASPSPIPKHQFIQRNTGKANNRDNGNHDMRAVFLYKSERENAGTGVFLPRTKGAPGEQRKKPVCSTVIFPERVVRALNLDLNEIAASSRFPSVYVLSGNGAAKGEPRKKGPHPPSARNELLGDSRLPPDWTY